MAGLASLNNMMFSNGMTTIDNTKWTLAKGLLANTLLSLIAVHVSVRRSGYLTFRK